MIENSPNVSIVTGKLMILSMGLRIKNIKARMMEPISNVSKPPSIVKPGTIWGIKYNAGK